jgi:hypothetical protein
LREWVTDEDKEKEEGCCCIHRVLHDEKVGCYWHGRTIPERALGQPVLQARCLVAKRQRILHWELRRPEPMVRNCLQVQSQESLVPVAEGMLA